MKTIAMLMMLLLGCMVALQAEEATKETTDKTAVDTSQMELPVYTNDWLGIRYVNSEDTERYMIPKERIFLGKNKSSAYVYKYILQPNKPKGIIIIHAREAVMNQPMPFSDMYWQAILIYKANTSIINNSSDLDAFLAKCKENQKITFYAISTRYKDNAPQTPKKIKIKLKLPMKPQ